MGKNILLLFFAFLTAVFLPSILFSEQFVFEKNIEKIGDGFYRGKIKHENYKDGLWCVMERIEQESKQQKYWQKYAQSQVENETEIMNFLKSETKKNFGARYFEQVLSENHPETWVAYVTSHANPQPHKVDKNHIKMYMSIVSSQEALVTSHMGISMTVESIPQKPARGISLPLHSFAAKVMLMENPKRRFMINSPLVDMAVILIKSSLKKLFIGSQSNAEKLFGKNYYDANNPKVVDAAFEDYVEREKTRQIQDIDDTANWTLGLLNKQVKEAQESDENTDISNILNKLGQDVLAEKYLEIDKVNGRFAIDNQKINELKNKIKNNEQFFPYLHSYSLQKKLGLLRKTKEYYTFLMKHRGIVEMKEDNSSMSIEDPENWNNIWLTIDSKNMATYSWLFEPTFGDLGFAGYFAIDLRELAEYGKLVDLV